MTDTATPNTPVNTTPVGTTENKQSTGGNQILLLENGRSVQLNAPTEAGQNAVVAAKGLEKVVANFDADKAEISMKDGNLVFTFENGSQTVIEQFELADPMPQIVLQDGTIVAGDVVVAQLEADGVDSLDLETAAGGARSGGGSTYSDDLGDVIGMLNATDGNGLVSGGGNGGNGGNLFGDGNRDGLGGFAPVTPIDTTPIVTDPNGAGSFISDETTDIGRVVNGTLNIDFGNDGIGNIEGTGFTSSALLTSDGQSITISYNALTNTFTATVPGGAVVFTLVLNQNGTYTFTQLLPLDHPNTNNPNDTINLTFRLTATDGDGDSINTQIVVSVNDDGPTATNSNLTTDESTDLGVAFIGDLNVDFGADGAGSVDLTGNVINGQNLTVDGQSLVFEVVSTNPTVIQAWTVVGEGMGMPTRLAFEITLNADGTYSFTQHLPLDHNGQGSVNIGFEFSVTDGDGDTTTGVINVNVSDDTNPIINIDDGSANVNVDETTDLGATINGQLNIDFGSDGAGSIALTGNVTTPNGDLLTSGGFPIVFTVVSTDPMVLQGWTDPTMVGSRAASFLAFEITINQDGSYTFTQFLPIDHPDGANPNDIISFGIEIVVTDGDGDSTTGTINVGIADDAPVAVDDTISANYNNNAGSVTGNIFGNDSFGADGTGSVVGTPDPNGMVGPNVVMVGPLVSVTFNGTVYNIPESGPIVINGQYGTLTISADGSYSYSLYLNVARPPEGAQDVFSYTIIDGDGDTSTANLTINVRSFNGEGGPTLGEGGTNSTIDESNALSEPGTVSPPWAHSFVNGTVNVNFGPDGQGTVAGNGNFTGPNGVELTSHGEPIIVTYDAATGTYTGTTAYGQQTVFFLEVRPDGSYVFRLMGALDHPDGMDPNDPLVLQFGFIATDADGDSVSSTINISVLDDAPVAADDTASVNIEDKLPLTGNLLDNDDFGADGRAEGHGDVVIKGQTGAVSTVTVNGVTYEIPSFIPRGQEGPTPITIMGEYGRLTIDCNGNYSYEPFPDVDVPDGAQDIFTYTIVDGDGDTSTANLVINVGSGDAGNPTIDPTGAANVNVDETMGIGVTVNGQLNIDFGPDGAGSIALTGNVIMPEGQQLASGGFPIVFTVVSTDPMVLQGWTDPTLVDSRAASLLAFEITVNQDGTYSFTQFMPLDHPDGLNPNDILSLGIQIVVTDADGDSATGTINIGIADDAPIAMDDSGSILSTSKLPLEGNLIENDDVGVDSFANGPLVTSVTFNGVVYPMPNISDAHTIPVGGGQPVGNPGFVTIQGQYGTLTVYMNGDYTYEAYGTSQGNVQDVFSYTITDGDGDTSTATLTINVDPDGGNTGTPSISPNGIDTYLFQENHFGETGGQPQVLIGAPMVFDYGSDGQGATGGIDGTGVFSSTVGASTTPIALTFSGIPIVVTYNASTGTYTGNAGGFSVFTLKLNDNGTYDFSLIRPIDHPANSGFNDSIRLTFGVQITDADGDTATANLNISIQDGRPVAEVVTGTVDEANLDPSAPFSAISAGGQLDYNFGGDGGDNLHATNSFQVVGTQNLSSGGIPVSVNLIPDDGVGGFVETYEGRDSFGTLIFSLTIFKANGVYSYQFHQFEQLDHPSGSNTLQLQFGYSVTDGDGDVANSTININVVDNGVNITATPDHELMNLQQNTPISGDMLENDIFSGSVDLVSVYHPANPGIVYHPVAGVPAEIQGLYGTFTVYADGTYSYQIRDGFNPPNGQYEKLVYVIEDANGNTSTAQLDIRFINGNGIPTIEPGGPDVSYTIEVDVMNVPVEGQLNFSYGADGQGVNGGVRISGVTNSLGSITVAGVPVTTSWSEFSQSYIGMAGTLKVFTLQIGDNGAYSFTLHHPFDGVSDSYLAFNVIVTDADGDRAGIPIVVSFDDNVAAGVTPVAHVEEEITLPIVIAPVDGNDELHVKPVDHEMKPVEHAIDILPQPEPVFEFAELAGAELQPAVALNDKVIEVDYSYDKGDVIDLSELIDVAELTEGGKALEAFINYDKNDGILTVDSTGTGNFEAETATRLDMVGFDGGKVKLAIQDMIVDTEFK